MNPGFQAQLKLYEAMGCAVDSSSALYKRYRLQMLTERYPGEWRGRGAPRRASALGSGGCVETGVGQCPREVGPSGTKSILKGTQKAVSEVVDLEYCAQSNWVG